MIGVVAFWAVVTIVSVGGCVVTVLNLRGGR